MLIWSTNCGPLIPESTRQVIFLGDGEFDGTTLQQPLAGLRWKYVSRTASNITICPDDEPFQIGVLAAMLPQGHCKGLQNCRITHNKYGPVTVVAWWAEGQSEPIFLVTNFLSPEGL